MWETQVLGRKDPLEKMATLSSVLAWKIPWTEEPGRLQSMESQRVGHNWVTFTFFSYSYWLEQLNNNNKTGSPSATGFLEEVGICSQLGVQP